FILGQLIKKSARMEPRINIAFCDTSRGSSASASIDKPGVCHATCPLLRSRRSFGRRFRGTGPSAEASAGEIHARLADRRPAGAFLPGAGKRLFHTGGRERDD